VVAPLRAGRVGDGRREAEHGEEVAHGEGDDQGGREGAPLAPADPAQPDLGRARQEPHAAQPAIEGALAADRGAGRLQRLAHGQPGGSPDRGQRRERRGEEAQRDAREQDGDVDRHSRVDGEEGGAEVPGEGVREHEAEHGARRRPRCAEQQRGGQVDARDLPAPAADRLHRPDLARLLADQRRHRVRDQHERREQREQRHDVEELRELIELGLAGPVSGRADLGQVRERLAAARCAKVLAHVGDRLPRRAVAGVAQPQPQRVEAPVAAQRAHRRRGRVQHHRALPDHLLAQAEVARLPDDRQPPHGAVGAHQAHDVSGPAAVAALGDVLLLGQHRSRGGRRARLQVDDVDALAREVRDPDDERLRPACPDVDARLEGAARLEGPDVRQPPEGGQLGRPQLEGARPERHVGQPAGRDLVLHGAVAERREREDADAGDRKRKRGDGEQRSRPPAGQVGDRLARDRRAHGEGLTRRRRRRRGSSRSCPRGPQARGRG
jgi:hypothetical protein